MTRSLLEFQNVTFTYPGTEKRIFHNLSFQLTEPGFHSLFGPSGVGKTSAARMITDDLDSYEGEINKIDMDIRLYSYNLERLPGWSSVRKHLDKITLPHRKERLAELVDVFGVSECLDSRFSQLSLGQQNRINLIRYLLQDFNMLIMDESLANVDELTRERILLHIKKMYPDAFFLYISHNVVEVSKFCDQILVFRDVHKQPQTILVKGQDHRLDKELDKGATEITMLEIMNAS